jgi:positive regulator of sigma E activity
MTEVGIVRKIDGPLVWVAEVDPKGCASCGSNGSCAGCDERSEGHVALALFGTPSKERLLTVRNSEGLSLQTGDKVEYYVAAGKAIKAGFLVLVLPVLCFLLFYGLAAFTFPHSGEGLRVLAGVAGLAVAFLVNLALRRRSGVDYPEIQRVLGRGGEKAGEEV